MDYKLEFQIDDLPNTTNNSVRLHWIVKAKEANKWKTRVVYLARHNGLPKEPLKYARLTLIRGSSREPDFDGLVSSFKHIIDGLITAKVLENDKMTNIGIPTYHWEKAKQGKGFIKVVVESVNKIE